jgi:hypothetical protein
MPDWLNRLAERQMQKARAEGKLANLDGEGQPLPDRPGDPFTDPGDALGFRIMAEAGVLPEEISLKKQISDAKARYRALTDEAARTEAMAEIARLELRRAIAEEARRAFLKP